MKNILDILKLTPHDKHEGVWLSCKHEKAEYKEWWPNGQLYMHSFFKNGKLDGECREWFGDGRPWLHDVYKEGVKIGKI